MNKNRILRALTLLLPIALIGGGTWWIAEICSKLEKYTMTKGKVSEFLVKGGGRMDADQDVVYYPKIRYFGENGQQYEFQSNIGSERPPFYEGEELIIFVNPDNQQDVVINSFMYLWIGPTIVLVAGFSLLAVFGLFFLRAARRSPRKSA